MNRSTTCWYNLGYFSGVCNTIVAIKLYLMDEGKILIMTIIEHFTYTMSTIFFQLKVTR